MKGISVMFRHILYHLFVLVTFLPLAFAFKFGFAGNKTDDAIYAFRLWCYRDSDYRPASMSPFHRGVFITGSLITIMLIVAVVVSGAASVGKSLNSRLTGPSPFITSDGTAIIPDSSATPFQKAVNPTVPNMLPVPAMTPVSYSTKLVRTMAAITHNGTRSFVTSSGQVVYVPKSVPSNAVLSDSSGTPVITPVETTTVTSSSARHHRSTDSTSPSPTWTTDSPSDTPTPSPSDTYVPSPSPTDTPTPEPTVVPTPSDSSTTASPTVSASPSDDESSLPGNSGHSGGNNPDRKHPKRVVSEKPSDQPSPGASQTEIQPTAVASS